MKELKVGERVTFTLEVVEQYDCKDCFFERFCECPISTCYGYKRSDGKSVIFKEVKE